MAAIILLLAIVALGDAAFAEGHRDDGSFAGHSNRMLGKSTKSAKSTKSMKSAKSTKRGKGKKRRSKAQPSGPPVPSPPEQSQLKQDIAAATSKRAKDRQANGWDDENKINCDNGTDTYQSCNYSIYQLGTGFECKCKLTRTGKTCPVNVKRRAISLQTHTCQQKAQVFDDVDANNDRYITWSELQAYIDQQTCVFPFKMLQNDGSIKEYTACTLDDEDSGHAWCSTRQNTNGFHNKGYYKYCTDEGNQQAWFDALAQFDDDGDGKLAFNEASRHARESRRRRERMLNTNDNFGAFICNDCITPDYCKNLAMATLDNHCRNVIKTVPLNDDDLLRLLALTMADIYCYEPDSLPESVESCPYELRHGVSDWLKRGPVTLVSSHSALMTSVADTHSFLSSVRQEQGHAHICSSGMYSFNGEHKWYVWRYKLSVRNMLKSFFSCYCSGCVQHL